MILPGAFVPRYLQSRATADLGRLTGRRQYLGCLPRGGSLLRPLWRSPQHASMLLLVNHSSSQRLDGYPYSMHTACYTWSGARRDGRRLWQPMRGDLPLAALRICEHKVPGAERCGVGLPGDGGFSVLCALVRCVTVTHGDVDAVRGCGCLVATAHRIRGGAVAHLCHWLGCANHDVACMSLHVVTGSTLSHSSMQQKA